MKYFIAIFFLLFSTLYANPNKKITLQLSWKNQFQFAGYYVAKELGYYKDAGLDVEIKEFKYGMNLSKAIENENADFAVGRSSLLINKAQGKDIVALGAIFQSSPMMLLVREDSGINTIKDLKNKKIMITTDAKSTASIIAMLNANKIQLKDVKVLKHSFNVQDLIDKKTDAMASYVSNEPIILEDKNIEYRMFHPKDYGFEFYNDILYTSSKFIKQNPEVTKKFYEASIKGWEYAFSHKGKTAKIIYDKYNTQKKSLVHLVSEGEALKNLIHHKHTELIGCLDKQKLQKIVDIYKVMGMINKDIDLDEFVYKHNNHKMININFALHDIYLLTTIAILILSFIIFIFFYLIIKRRWLLTRSTLEQEIKNKTNKLHKQSLTDFLTKAHNRKAYIGKFKELISLYNRLNTPFSILLFDIDDFKQVNDTYGHKVGDNVLIELTKLTESSIRDNDFLFRVGGEEFVVLFSQTTLKESIIATEKIRLIIQNKLNTIKNQTITISLGLTEIKKGDTEDTIYKRVDDLMYKSKNSGKNRLSYN
jgi:diguanylate cyclase (GGDEF)-like protein